MEGSKIGWCFIIAFVAALGGAAGAPLPISNASFESPALGAGARSDSLPNWTERDGVNNTNAFIEHIAGFSADGNQHVGMVSGYYIWQDTGVAWQPNTRYTLRVAAGRRGGHTASPNATLYALLNEPPNAGAQPTGSDVVVGSSNIVSGSFDASAIPDLTFADAAPIEVTTGLVPPAGNVVVFLGDGGVGRSHFDDVRLDAVKLSDVVGALTNPGNFNALREPAPPPGAATVITGTNTWSVDYDPLANKMYWSFIDSGEIWRTDPDGQNAELIVQESGTVLRGLQVDPYAGVLYFLDSLSDGVWATDLEGSSFQPVVGGFTRPNDMVLDRVDGRLYVTDSGVDNVLRHDLGGGAPVSWPIDGAWGIAIDQETETVYVSTDTGEVHAFDKDGTPDAGNPVFQEQGAIFRGMEWDPVRCLLHVVDAKNDRVLEIDPAASSSELSTLFATPLNNPRDLVIIENTDRDGDFLPDLWELDQLGTIAQQPSTDGDNDFRDLFTEYAFGGHPGFADPPVSAGPFDLPSAGSITFDQMVRVTDPGLAFTAMMSIDLQAWDGVPAGALTTVDFAVPNQPDYSIRRYIVDLSNLPPLLPQQQIFFRVEVEQSPKVP
jgi:hypothetical protein